MPDIDFFGFFRFWLATIVTIYASIVTLQSFRNWSSWLAGNDKYSSLLRRYLMVHGLRLRQKSDTAGVHRGLPVPPGLRRVAGDAPARDVPRLGGGAVYRERATDAAA